MTLIAPSWRIPRQSVAEPTSNGAGDVGQHDALKKGLT
jgi:hypothetical protein